MIVVLAKRPTTCRLHQGQCIGDEERDRRCDGECEGYIAATPPARVSSTRPQRVQAALPPGGSAGMRCNKSQSGQATDGGTPVTGGCVRSIGWLWL